MRTYLVTGATSGIGLSCVEIFSKQGAELILTGRNLEKLQDVQLKAQQWGAKKVHIIEVDLSLSTAAKTVRDYIEAVGLEKIDSIVHSAGIARKENIDDLTFSSMEEVFKLNVFTPALITKELLGFLLAASKPSVVFVSSIAGRLRSLTLGCHYSSSKAALIGLTRHLAAELGPRGVRVNAICPSQTKTEMLEYALPKAQWETFAAQNPLRRLSEPVEQANVIAFLCSDEASYMNGSIIDVNGGVL
ncbi:MAG: SDR family NAD(P)-dependent oxidoreductase [Bdellovibrio sp.]